MLARKVGYMNFQNSAAYPLGKSSTYSGSRAEERHFSLKIQRWLLLISVIGVILLANVALSAMITNNGYNLMQEKQTVQQLHRDNEILRLEIAKMQTPDRIYSIATTKLGMVTPTMVLYGPSYKNSTAKNSQ